MSRPTLLVVAAAILVGDRCLVGRRKPGGSFGELWEFPGGKVEPGERPDSALEREIREELGVDIRIEELLSQSEFASPSRNIALCVYAAGLQEMGLRIECRDHLELRWVGASELELLPFAAPDLPALPKVQRLLEKALPAPLPRLIQMGPTSAAGDER